MNKVSALPLRPVWVDPTHLTASAKFLMEGHRVRCIAVLESGALVGLLTAEKLAASQGDEPVAGFMIPSDVILTPEMSVRQAAALFLEKGIEFAPVLDGARFLGIASSVMLLRELSRSWDPMTNLSWQDLLREWGVENLKAGREIAILFIDLNDFGLYNKRYGHAIGDLVIRKVADLLSESIDGARDVLVRYGGDEFAIGTLRERSEAEFLADMLRRRAGELYVGEVKEPVTFSVGVWGGKRTNERSEHVESTLDNLINLASKDCLRRKKDKPSAPQVAIAVGAEPGLKVDAAVRPVVAELDTESPSGMTTVTIEFGGRVQSGVVSRIGESTLNTVAEATARALEGTFPDRRMRIEDIRLSESPLGQKVATIAAIRTDASGAYPVSGASIVGEELYRSVADATIEAFLAAHA